MIIIITNITIKIDYYMENKILGLLCLLTISEIFYSEKIGTFDKVGVS